jgi:hypothetical protein
MKSLIKVDSQEDGVLISLAIKLEPSEAGKVMISAVGGDLLSPEELVELHEQYGIGVSLAMLRTYLFSCANSGYTTSPKKRRRKKK